MDLLKNNLFYIILVASILVISIPSSILASRQNAKHAEAVENASRRVKALDAQLRQLDPVSPAALEAAARYQQSWQEEIGRVKAAMAAADRYLDGSYILPPREGADTPVPEAYRGAYNAAFAGLMKRMGDNGLLGGDRRGNPFGKLKHEWGDVVPTPQEILITQKEYFILNELIDVMLDPECKVVRVTQVTLDTRPGGENTPSNRANPGESSFWLYPMKVEFQLDFRALPIFLRKLTSSENVIFVPNGYRISRAFLESEPTYTPLVAVTLYCNVYDYISTAREKAAAAQWKPKQAGPGGARR